MRDHDRDRDFGRELGEEAKGLGQQVKGKIKEETGDLLDDRSMEIEGKVEKNVGKIRRELNNPTDAMNRDRDWSEGSDVTRYERGRRPRPYDGNRSDRDHGQEGPKRLLAGSRAGSGWPGRASGPASFSFRQPAWARSQSHGPDRA